MAERRYDPLGDRWVIVSAGRVSRPWHGETGEVSPRPPAFEPHCHLCPGNARATGVTNPAYQGVYVFDNDFPALADVKNTVETEPLFRAQPATGRCRVVCYDHRHDLTLAELPAGALGRVAHVWAEEHEQLGKDHGWVQIFENKGRMMGCSSDHPHGQIWASAHVPSIAEMEDRTQAAHFASHGAPLLVDYAAEEVARGSRVVALNGSWLAVVPWWAAWPFETLLLPRRAVPDFAALHGTEFTDLCDLLHRLLGAYDGLFGVPMPYSMGWHARGRVHGEHWQLHAHFYPPLLRSATLRKFMVGYEMLAEAQRDLTAELAAERLRAHLPAGE